MTATDRRTPELSLARPARPAVSRWGVVSVLGLLAVGVGLLLPDGTSRKGAGDGAMTHYMGLLAANQPWNLLLFMAVPVILAETLAITELTLLFSADAPDVVRRLNRWAGLIAGVWFTGIVVYLLANAVVPITSDAGWRGIGDVLSVGSYLLGIIPLGGIALLELGVLGTGSARERAKLHAILVGVFLVVAHVAMIFGMLDPSLLGWHAHTTRMPGMDM